jgi:hypothetical protein
VSEALEIIGVVIAVLLVYPGTWLLLGWWKP